VVQIRQGNDAGAEAVFQKVLTDYASHPRLPEAVHAMAEAHFRQAFQVSRLDLMESSGPCEYTRTHLGKAIEKWNLIIEQMPRDTSAMPIAYYYLARAYYHLRDYEKAERHCTTLLERWPAHELAWEAQFLVAKMAKRMIAETGRPETEPQDKMKAAFEQLLENYPNCPAAATAHKWLVGYHEVSQGGKQ